MKNYAVITDEIKLKEFIDWLPVLKPNETYYLCLLARSKYVRGTGLTHISSDKQQLKRFTSNKERMFDKIKQLEVELGAYKNNKGVIIPQEALAVYITVNPRDIEKATKNSTKTFIDLISSSYTGYNPHQIVMSEIQKAKGQNRYVTFDFDIPEEVYNPNDSMCDLKIGVQCRIDIMLRIINFINEEAITVISTRGGIHVLVDPNRVTKNKNSWYTSLINLQEADKNINSDAMIPVVGTYQGGYIPNFLLK